MADEYERGTEYQSEVPAGTGGASEKARATGRDMLDRAVQKKDELKQRAATLADDRRTGAAERGSSISRALHGAADTLRDSGEPQLSSWVHQAAGQVERVVGYLEGKHADGMANDLENLARQNPALFLGGTYIAGLAFGRFLRASSPERRGPEHGDAAYPGENLAAVPENGGTTGWTGVGVAPGAFGAAGTSERALGGSVDAGVVEDDLRTSWQRAEPVGGRDREGGWRGSSEDPESMSGSTRDLEPGRSMERNQEAERLRNPGRTPGGEV